MFALFTVEEDRGEGGEGEQGEGGGIILAKINVGGLLESLIMCVSGKLAVMSQETALVHIH